MRKGAHWHKPDPRECLIEDVNEWVREMTGDQKDGLPEGTRMTRRELNAICRAITAWRLRKPDENKRTEPYSRGCLATVVPGATCQSPDCDC